MRPRQVFGVLALALAALLASACSSRRDCGRLRTEARAAITASRTPPAEHEAAQRRASELSDRSFDLVSSGQYALMTRLSPCRVLRELAADPHPVDRDLESDRERAGFASRGYLAAPATLSAAGQFEPVLAVRALAAGVAFDAELTRWDAVVPRAPQPGAPWSAAQRRYLLSLAAAGCHVDAVIKGPMTVAQKTLMDLVPSATRDARLAFEESSSMTSQNLAASTMLVALEVHPAAPLVIPDELDDVPRFEPARRAVLTFNACVQ